MWWFVRLVGSYQITRDAGVLLHNASIVRRATGPAPGRTGPGKFLEGAAVRRAQPHPRRPRSNGLRCEPVGHLRAQRRGLLGGTAAAGVCGRPEPLGNAILW